MMGKTLEEILGDVVEAYGGDRKYPNTITAEAHRLIEQAVLSAKPGYNAIVCDGRDEGIDEYEANLKAWLGKGK